TGQARLDCLTEQSYLLAVWGEDGYGRIYLGRGPEKRERLHGRIHFVRVRPRRRTIAPPIALLAPHIGDVDEDDWRRRQSFRVRRLKGRLPLAIFLRLLSVRR